MVSLDEAINRLRLILTALHQKPMNIQELSRVAGLNYNATYRWVETLARQGLLTKQIDPGPPRQLIITLTPTGKCLAQCLTTPTQPKSRMQRPHETPGEHRSNKVSESPQ